MRRRKWERERSRGRAGAWRTAWGTLRGAKAEAGGCIGQESGDGRPAGAKGMDDERSGLPPASRPPRDVKSGLPLDCFVLETR